MHQVGFSFHSPYLSCSGGWDIADRLVYSGSSFKLVAFETTVPKFRNGVATISQRAYVVLPKNSGNLNRGPEPLVVLPSAAKCG